MLENIQKYYKHILTQATSLGLLVLSFFTSLLLAPIFRLPFQNPYNISNPNNTTGFNPDNNYIGILFITVATIFIFYALSWLYANKYNWVIKMLVSVLLLGNFFIFQILTISAGYATGMGGLDNFHSGEQLSPASAFLSGSNIYSDLFFLRGAGVDVIIPAIGLIIFGKTIGSFILINPALTLLTILGFLILAAFKIKDALLFALFAVFFYASGAVNIMQIRDLPIWLIFGLILLLFRNNLSYRSRNILLACVGFLSGMLLYISVDRGVAAIGLTLFLSIMLIFFKVAKKMSTHIIQHRGERTLSEQSYQLLDLR